MSCSNLQGGLHVTQLRQPPGSDVVIACTAKRQLMLWRPNPGAAFRTFTARQTWYGRHVPYVEQLTFTLKDFTALVQRRTSR